MKLPTRSLPPNFGSDIQSAGLGGLPFSWGSDADLNLDDPRLTPEQKNAILGVALKDTPLASAPGAPLAVSNQDVMRFLAQRDASALPGVGAIGGGGDTGAPPGAPGAPDTGLQDSMTTENGQAVDTGSPSFSMPSGTLGNALNFGLSLAGLGLSAATMNPLGIVSGLNNAYSTGKSLFGAGTGNAPPNSTNFGRVPQQYVAPDDTAAPAAPQTTVEDAVAGMTGIGPTGGSPNAPTAPDAQAGVEGMTNDANATGQGGSGNGPSGSAGDGPTGDGGPSSGDYARGGSVRKARASRVANFEKQYGGRAI